MFGTTNKLRSGTPEENRLPRHMGKSSLSERGRLFFLILILAIVAMVVLGTAILILYNTALKEDRMHLVGSAQSQARLIEAIARFDADYERAYPGSHPEGPLKATLDQIVDAHRHYKGSGETGEFTLAKREGDQIIFLLTHRHGGHGERESIRFDSERAEPMQLALSGKSGTVIGLDYRGKVVLAAYEPVAELDLGIVTKIDLAEVRAPFVKASILLLVVSVFLVIIGAFLFLRVINPMIKHLEHELTERKRAEEKIKEYSGNLERMVEERTKELNRALFDTEKARDRIDGILKAVADGLIVTDKYNRVVLINRAAEDLLGIYFSEVINRPIDFAILDETLLNRLKSTLSSKKTGTEFDFQLPGDVPKRPKIMRARTSVIYDKKGEGAGMITIIHDVSHEREVDRMKTEFISTAAHELRTPLTSIQGFSELLLTRKDLKEEEKEEFISYINKQSVNLATIVNDLLDISRLESGRSFLLNKEKCVVGDAIKRIIPYVQGMSSKHKLKVVLPEEPVELLADKEKMEQVLKNLLSNAVKYSPDGGLIRVTGEISEDHFQVSVEDQGIGMTPEQLERIFEKFYRVDASHSAIEGTGLGMNIVKYIVEAHGGEIWVESELGKGTTVKFVIPI